MSDDAIKTRIAALLAKAESTDNAYEQDAFLAKVNELLEKHQLEMAEIRAHSGKEADELSSIVGFMTRSHEWPSQVAWKFARFLGCKMIRHTMNTKAQYQWTVIGRKSACITFDLMLPYVFSQVRQQARAWSRREGITVAKAERSIGMALADRIANMIPRAEKRRNDLGQNALIPVDDLEAFVKSMFGDVKAARALSAPIYAGADEYAGKISIDPQVAATGAGLKQIGAK